MAATINVPALPEQALERATMNRVARRLLPLLILCYFVAYLDRVNIGFAGLTMNKALGFSSAVFGFGGGIFFLGYFIFEVPSNVILERVGARTWIARILVTWGITRDRSRSACTRSGSLR
jgi:MFS transporter, ACS family, tartrate transporter